MKKLIRICSSALICSLLTVGVAHASPFVLPPEDNFPGGGGRLPIRISATYCGTLALTQ